MMCLQTTLQGAAAQGQQLLGFPDLSQVQVASATVDPGVVLSSLPAPVWIGLLIIGGYFLLDELLD